MTQLTAGKRVPGDQAPAASSWWQRWGAEGAVLLLAAAVRGLASGLSRLLVRRGGQPGLAEDNPAFIWANTFPLLNDKHRPAYYLLLHYWQKGLAIFGLDHADGALRRWARCWAC